MITINKTFLYTAIITFSIFLSLAYNCQAQHNYQEIEWIPIASEIKYDAKKPYVFIKERYKTSFEKLATGHPMFIPNGTMIMRIRDFGYIYSNDSAKTWHQVEANANVPGLPYKPHITTYKDVFILTNGDYHPMANSIYTSADGIHWTKAPNDQFNPKHHIQFNGKIWKLRTQDDIALLEKVKYNYMTQYNLIFHPDDETVSVDPNRTRLHYVNGDNTRLVKSDSPEADRLSSACHFCPQYNYGNELYIYQGGKKLRAFKSSVDLINFQEFTFDHISGSSINNWLNFVHNLMYMTIRIGDDSKYAIKQIGDQKWKYISNIPFTYNPADNHFYAIIGKGDRIRTTVQLYRSKYQLE